MPDIEIPDDKIYSNIKDVLSSKLDPDSEINFEVNKGSVFLKGTTDTLREKDKIEDYVKGIEGVNKILNNIVIATDVPDKEIAKNIEEELEKFMVDVNDIDISVTNGKVTISGNVKNIQERDTIINTITGVSGIREIDDKMIVRFSGIM